MGNGRGMPNARRGTQDDGRRTTDHGQELKTGRAAAEAAEGRWQTAERKNNKMSFIEGTRTANAIVVHPRLPEFPFTPFLALHSPSSQPPAPCQGQHPRALCWHPGDQSPRRRTSLGRSQSQLQRQRRKKGIPTATLIEFYENARRKIINTRFYAAILELSLFICQ